MRKSLTTYEKSKKLWTPRRFVPTKLIDVLPLWVSPAAGFVSEIAEHGGTVAVFNIENLVLLIFSFLDLTDLTLDIVWICNIA